MSDTDDIDNPVLAIEAYPPTLPIEIALRIKPAPQIFRAYGLGEADFNRLRMDELFLRDVARYADELKVEGASFRLKARLQSEEYLKHSWDLVTSKSDDVPAAVKADLIKHTWKMAGLEPKKELAQGATNNLQIVIDLS